MYNSHPKRNFPLLSSHLTVPIKLNQMKLQLSSRPVRGIFMLIPILLMVASIPIQGLQAQNYPVICPGYTPEIPDYMEMETCGSNSNTAMYANPSYTGNCAEQLPFPVPQGRFVLQGTGSAEVAVWNIDHYVFEVVKNSEVRITSMVSHQVVNLVTFLELTPDWYACAGFEENPYPPGNQFYLSDGNSLCSQDFSMSLPKGFYMMQVNHTAPSSINPITMPGCDNELEYQISIENLGSYNDGGSCSFAQEITAKPTFAESQIPANLLDGELSNAMGCLSSTVEQRSMWFKFTATHENMFIMARRNGISNLNATVEVYDDCNGAPILCQNAFAGNVNEVVIVNNTIIGHEYYFKVYHNGQGVLSGGNIFAAVAHVPTTQLIATDCGRTGLIPTSVIRSAWPVNQFLLSNWMFKFQEMSPPFNVYEVISPNGNNPNFRLNWFPQLQAGRTYAVWTRPKMYQGPTWGDYGTSCLITMAPAAAGMIAYDDDETSTSEGYRFVGGNMIVDVWPNPAHEEVMIRFNASEDDAYADIRIVDVSGKEVDHLYRTFEGGEIQTLAFTTENLTTGIYLIHVRTASGSTVAKLAVNH